MLRKKHNVPYLDILLRYIIILILSSFNFYIITITIAPITVYSSYLLFSLFYPVILFGNDLVLENYAISIVNACLAIPAYYLLIALNLSTPNIKLKKRILILIISFSTLLIFNLIRIIFMTFIFISYNNLFNVLHIILWIFVSSFLILFIWFFTIKIFNIKSIPFYSDIIYLYNKHK